MDILRLKTRSWKSLKIMTNSDEQDQTAPMMGRYVRIMHLGLNEIYVWFLLPTYPNFFNPTLNIKMVFGEKNT